MYSSYQDDLLAIIRYMVKREAKEGISDETMINVLAFDIDQLSKTIEKIRQSTGQVKHYDNK